MKKDLIVKLNVAANFGTDVKSATIETKDGKVTLSESQWLEIMATMNGRRESFSSLSGGNQFNEMVFVNVTQKEEKVIKKGWGKNVD